MNLSKLQANIDAVREFVQGNWLSIVAEKEISYGYQLLVSDGIYRIPVDLFTTGKALIQGKPCALQNELKSWLYSRKAPSNISIANFTGRPRMGLDESGKG